MDPIAFSLGPIAIHWYGILIASAFLIGILGTARHVRRAGLNEDDYYSLIMLIVVFAILGARLYYVIFEWPHYAVNPADILAVWKGGLAVHGGIIAGCLTLFLGCRHYRLPFWQVSDIIAPFLILGQAIGRWGNYFNGEAFGYVVDKAKIPWAIYVQGEWHHPTFLYESIWNLIGFFVLIAASKHDKIKTGDVSLLYFMYYSIGRFFIEGLRTDSLMLGPLRMAQVMSVLLFSSALVLFLKHRQSIN